MPLKYYGATSRFLTKAVMACMEPVSWVRDEDRDDAKAKCAPAVDVASTLRGLWS
jgi:hypothetical protein